MSGLQSASASTGLGNVLICSASVQRPGGISWTVKMALENMQWSSECKLVEFLSHRGPAVHFLAPADLVQAMREHNPASQWTATQGLDEPLPPTARRIFVYDPGDEQELMFRASARYLGAQVFGIKQHIVPLLVGSPGRPDLHLLNRELPVPALSFAVVCAPRTGSTFLCELLRDAGLGAPREHLRHPLVKVLADPRTDQAAVLKLISGLASVEGVFGTKFISHFLTDALGQQTQERMRCLAERGFRFILLERDPVERAVSAFVSKSSGVWHVRGAVGEGLVRRINQVEFDSDRLMQIYGEARRMADDAVGVLELVPEVQVLRLDYADLQKDPLGVLQVCADFLGLSQRGGAVNFATLPQRLASSKPQVLAMQRQLRELLERIGEPPIGVSDWRLVEAVKD